MSRALHEQSLTELSLALRTQQVSAVELAQHFLARARADTLGAFLALDEEASLAQARASDARLAAGTHGPLEGVPIAHKDVFVTRDFPTTAGSNILRGYRSPFDATVVQKLGSGINGQGGAGMVSLGKLSCDEFAMGSSNENVGVPAVGHKAPLPVRNPWDVSRIPGGSSGGSAAAVAARLTPAATGTDTGGSIRQPASFCGITGIKPTYGRASRYGMIAYASSLDQAGAMARSAEDCALLLSAMCGADLDRDSTSLDVPTENFSRDLMRPLAKAGKDGGALKIGIPREWMRANLTRAGSNDAPAHTAQGADPEVQRRIEEALQTLEQQGAQCVDISLANAKLAIPVYYIIAPAEASSNLSRFDGVKFGHRASDYTDLESMYKNTRAEGFGEEVKRRIMTGAYVLSHGYYDAYYLQAQKIRRMIADDFQRAFAECDVIAGPVAPSLAWPLGHNAQDPLADYLADIFTLPASLAGLPCMSVPVGFGEGGMQNNETGSGKPLPVGMQLIGNYLQEARLLNVAHQYQINTDFHSAKPEDF